MPPKALLSKKRNSKKQPKVKRKPTIILDDNSEGTTQSSLSADGAAACDINDDDESSQLSNDIDVPAKKLTAKKETARKTKQDRQFCPNGKLDINLCTITSLKKVTTTATLSIAITSFYHHYYLES